MSQAQAYALLRDGIAAAKAGNKPLTRRLLRQVTELDPRNELAWLWLAGVAESTEDSLSCLNQVLEINPEHPLLARIRAAEDGEFDQWARLLLDQALLAEGAQIADPAAFVKRLNALLLK